MNKDVLIKKLNNAFINCGLKKDFGNNIYEFAGLFNALVYVKESNANPPIWGLTSNRIDQLNESKKVWFVIFLHTTLEKVYLLSSNDIKGLVTNKNVAGDGDFKINLKDVSKYEIDIQKVFRYFDN